MAVFLYPPVVPGGPRDPWRNNPIVGWRNRLAEGVLTPSSEGFDGWASNALSGTTWDFWRPGRAPATLEVELGSAEACDFAAVAAHTCGSTQTRVICEYWQSGAWREAAAALPGTDEPLMMVFPEEIAARWRLRLDGPGEPVIGVAMIGPSLTMERRVYGGHTPITLGADIAMSDNVSLGGHLLGASIVTEGASTSIDIANLSAAWVRGSLEPFRQHYNRGRGFFWAWRPERFPSEVAYCWRDGAEMALQNNGIRDLMDLSFGVKAYVG